MLLVTEKFDLRMFAPKSSHAQIFLVLPRRKVMIYFCQKGKKKKWRVTDFVLERTVPEKYPK